MPTKNSKGFTLTEQLIMTEEQIIQLALIYFEESFVEYDEHDNELVDFTTSKEQLLKFARVIFEKGCESVSADGVY